MSEELDPFLLVLAVVAVSLWFDFCNGWNDSANAIATLVSTRVLPPGVAITMNAVLNFAGALVSTKVAKTIAGKFVDAQVMSLWAVGGAAVAASLWVMLCTRRGLPVSGSHSLMGGIIGAALGASAAQGGHPAVLKWNGITPALVALAASPLMGMLCGFVLIGGSMWSAYLAKLSASKAKRLFSYLQFLSSSMMAFQHGKNDAQKVMGMITLALVTLPASGAMAGLRPEMDAQGLPRIPLWVMIACATVMGLGTAAGGWRVIRTLGRKLAHLRPVEGFSAEVGASVTLHVASELGIPVSTTHTITGSILGVGAARRAKAVKWGLGAKILLAWIFTFPATILLSMALVYGLECLFQ